MLTLSRRSRTLGLSLGLIAVAVALPARARAQEDVQGWPREIAADSGKLVIYEPQFESLNGITLTARAAVAYVGKGKTEPLFGVVWFTSRAQTDRDARTVTIDRLAVSRARYQGVTAVRRPRRAAAGLRATDQSAMPSVPSWPPGPDEVLVLDDLRTSLPTAAGAVHAVRGVSLVLRRGVTTALVGESGSGKTMLARSVLGILPDGAQCSGRVWLDGRDLRTLDASAMR